MRRRRFDKPDASDLPVLVMNRGAASQDHRAGWVARKPSGSGPARQLYLFDFKKAPLVRCMNPARLDWRKHGTQRRIVGAIDSGNF